MLKTKLFIGINSLETAREYQQFINENQQIRIISVNVLRDNFIILTYELKSQY